MSQIDNMRTKRHWHTTQKCAKRSTMPVLFILAIPFIEISVWLSLAQNYGWLNMIAWECFSFFLGIMFIRRQSGVARPDIKQIIGGFLLLTPGVITDVIGLTLVLPGLRDIWSLFFQKQLERAMNSGRVKGFTYQWGSVKTQAPNEKSPNHGAGEVIDVEYKEVRDAEFLPAPSREEDSP